jgi:hypothetical protein
MFGQNTWKCLLPVCAAVSALICTTAAKAFDQGNCKDFGSLNLSRAATFNTEAGGADFGDDPHWFGNPVGTAVICWFSNGRVGIKGKVFADTTLHGDPVVATAEVRFRRTNGQFTPATTISIGTNIAWVASSLVQKLSPQGNFNRVRVRLFDAFPADLEHTPNTLVSTRTFSR